MAGRREWRLIGAAAVALAVMLAAAPGRAAGIEDLEHQIDTLRQTYQRQIDALQAQIDQLKAAQARHEVTARRAAARQAAEAARGPHVVETRSHEFGLESADGQNAIYLTGRIHFDVGGYFDYHRPAGSRAPLSLADGANFRRARIGVVGKFLGDWDYGLIYDFGGSSDTLVTGQSGAPLSGIENAYLVYNGLHRPNSALPVSFVLGAIDVPWTLGEAVASNDTLFLERASSQVIATSFGGGDSRLTFGATANDERYFLGAFLTGPTTGALHTYNANKSPAASAPCTITPNSGTEDCSGPQLAFLARGSYRVLASEDGSLQLGVDFGDDFRPRNGANQAFISLADRPELRVDPTALLGTGSIAAADGMVFGAEAAATWHHAFVMGEYFHYRIDQLAAGFPALDFNGGYVDASYSFGGERHYKAGAGGYTAVIPDRPLSWSGSGWGALELAARYSIVDLDTGTTGLACPAASLASVRRVCGGRQQSFTIGVNYYPNDNIRFMLDFEHVDVAAPAGTATAKAASLDDVALRTQLNW